MANNDDFSLLEDEQSPSEVRARPVNRHASQSISSSEAQKSREESLRQELASVKRVNETIKGLLASLEKAKTNMKTVNSTVSAASSLLNTWTRILSQTEHNQRLILDPTWQGASQDIADIEEEAQAKQDAAERREQEEQERKAAAARKAEEDERRRAEAATRVTTKTTSRGRGRGVSTSRGANSMATSSTPATTSSNSSLLRAPSTSRRGTSGIGRVRGVRGKT